MVPAPGDHCIWPTSVPSPCGPVNGVRAAFEDPQALARDLVVDVGHPTLGSVRTPATAVRVGDTRPPPNPGPGLAAHTGEVLAGLLGYHAEAISKLTSAGAFGELDEGIGG